MYVQLYEYFVWVVIISVFQIKYYFVHTLGADGHRIVHPAILVFAQASIVYRNTHNVHSSGAWVSKYVPAKIMHILVYFSMQKRKILQM